MNKKGLEFKNFFFALIAFSMFIIASGTIIGEWNIKYGSGLDNDLGAFNKLDSITNDTLNKKGKISTTDPAPGEDAEAQTFRGVYGIMGAIFSSFDIVIGDDGLINSIFDRFQIPDYVKQGIIAAMLISIIFTLIAIIFRLGRSA